MASSILEYTEQVALNVPYIPDGNPRFIRKNHHAFHSIQFSNITGDRYIAASGFFIIRKEVCDRYTRLFFFIGHDEVGIQRVKARSTHSTEA